MKLTARVSRYRGVIDVAYISGGQPGRPIMPGEEVLFSVTEEGFEPGTLMETVQSKVREEAHDRGIELPIL